MYQTDRQQMPDILSLSRARARSHRIISFVLTYVRTYARTHARTRTLGQLMPPRRWLPQSIALTINALASQLSGLTAEAPHLGAGEEEEEEGEQEEAAVTRGPMSASLTQVAEGVGEDVRVCDRIDGGAWSR